MSNKISESESESDSFGKLTYTIFAPPKKYEGVQIFP